MPSYKAMNNKLATYCKGTCSVILIMIIMKNLKFKKLSIVEMKALQGGASFEDHIGNPDDEPGGECEGKKPCSGSCTQSNGRSGTCKTTPVSMKCQCWS